MNVRRRVSNQVGDQVDPINIPPLGQQLPFGKGVSMYIIRSAGAWAHTILSSATRSPACRRRSTVGTHARAPTLQATSDRSTGGRCTIQFMQCCQLIVSHISKLNLEFKVATWKTVNLPRTASPGVDLCTRQQTFAEPHMNNPPCEAKNQG